jgi:hypothetical protein
MSMCPKDNWIYLPALRFPIRITTLPGEDVGTAIGRIFGTIPATPTELTANCQEAKQCSGAKPSHLTVCVSGD